MTSKPQGPPFNLGQEGESEDLRTQGNRWTIGPLLTKKLSIFSAMYPCVPFIIICAQVFPKCPSGEGSSAKLRQPWLRWRTWHRVWTKEDRWVSFRMWSDKRYIFRISYDILSFDSLCSHDILQNIFFCSYSSLVCPTAPSYSPPAGPPEMGSELVFSLPDLLFSVVMRGTTSFKKTNLTFCLGAGECISAQQSPIRHISRRGREGAGLLISWYFCYKEN